jgi:hypothetical protein
MGSIRNRDTIGEPDNNGSGTKIRGKACKNGETGVKAYGKFQLSGIFVITSSPKMPDSWNFPYAFTPVSPFLHAFPLKCGGGVLYICYGCIVCRVDLQHIRVLEGKNSNSR